MDPERAAARSARSDSRARTRARPLRYAPPLPPPTTTLALAQVRGQAVALAVQANFASNLIVSFLFPIEIDGWGKVVGEKSELAMTFGIFLIIDFYALWFVHRNVPETAGKTLEQIEVALRGKQTTSINTPLLEEE